MMHRYIFSLGILIFLVTSCGNPAGPDEGKTVFRYNESSGITSLDPAFSKDLANIWPCNQLYNSLVDLNDQLEPVPSLARRWETSADGLTYTFFLRDDIFFHDHPLFPGGKGRKANARDVAYSFNRILDPKVASPGAWVFSKVDHTGGGPAFQAMNDSVFQVRLYEPFPPFLGILSMKYCSVVPFEIVEHYGDDFRKNPVGTGPFRFSMWKEGVKLVLLKNENYFESEGGSRLPYLDAVSVSFQIDRQSAFLEFVKGNLDFISGIDPAYKDEVLTRDGRLREKYSDDIYMLTVPYLNTEYLGMLVDTSALDGQENPFGSRKVRQAMNWAIDREKMASYLRNNLVTPGHYGILPPGLMDPDSTERGYFHDPGMARQCLADAGFPGGKGLPVINLYTTSDYLDIFKYVQYQYAQTGIRMEIEVTPYATLKELKAQAKVSFFRASWIADYPDPENYLSLFCSWNFSPSGPNYTHFSNSHYDSLYRLSQSTMDDLRRKELYREMNDLIIQEAPVVVLYYDQVVRLISSEVKGLGINPLNMLHLKKVRVSRQDREFSHKD